MSLFDRPAPRLYAMPPHAAFLDALAEGLLGELADPDAPFALADATILLPTRRAARALGEAFVRASGGAPSATLLPSIRAIGDVDADEPPFAPGDVALGVPPEISPARRRFELGRLVHAFQSARDKRADPAAALPLADELGKLLDELAEAGVADLSALDEMFAALPEHLQHAKMFLRIVQKAWPARLAELGRIDAAQRRDMLLRRLARQWTEAPPERPVIAAGSTGTVPATAELLKAVASAPKGLVVLPGLDADLDAGAWDQIDDQHPQSGMRRLLETLGAERGAVAPWPTVEEGPRARARRRLVNEALRPAPATADWLARVATLKSGAGGDAVAHGLDGLTLAAAANEEEEARIAALAVRQALEEAGATAMVVCADRGLSARIAAILARWEIAPDLSAGDPLIETPAGAFLTHLLDLARDAQDPVALAAVVKHPLCALAGRELFGKLERVLLRGVRPGDPRAALKARASDARFKRAVEDAGLDVQAADALLARVEDALAPLQPGDASVEAFAEAHARAAEAFAGAGRIWAGQAGETAALLLRELMGESEAFPDVDLDGYARVFTRLARARPVRPRAEAPSRVRVLGPLEARLQSADLVVLAGLNEGTWPAAPSQDPFLSRPMRAAAGLASPERRVGLAAHDFAQLASAPRVLMTRSNRAGGAPAVASRWLWRLETLAKGAGVAVDDPGLTALARALDRVAAQDAGPLTKGPNPTPPVATRPRKMSVSAVKDWVRDPYKIYARFVLNLEALDPLDRPPGARERGSALHAALEVALKDRKKLDGLEDAIIKAARAEFAARGFGPTALAREEARIARAARWFAAFERERRTQGWTPALFEERGTMVLDGLKGRFEVYGVADRIDQGPAGWAILDYKTGKPPSQKQAEAGLEPQMPLEAAILAAGGYDDAASQPPVELAFVRVSGGRVAGEFAPLKDAAALAAGAADGLKRRVDAYDRETTGYPSQSRVMRVGDVGDYDRLARRKEWASPAGGEGEE